MVDPATFLTIITPIVSGGLSGATTVGLFKGPVKTLEDWWFVNFGASLSQQAALLRAEQEANVEKLKSGILDNVSKIEPENIQDPKLNILGPALEASKYYIEDEKLRDMFAKLIAASMDKSKNEIIHNSFAEIIKQMSPLDAENLVAISDNGNPIHDSICNLLIDNSDGSFTTEFVNLYLGNSNQPSQENIGMSLSNLTRLGLIELDYQEHNFYDSFYSDFRELNEYQCVVEKIEEENQLLDSIREYDPEDTGFTLTLSGPRLQKGIIRKTSYGQAFISTCLKESFAPIRIFPVKISPST